MAVFQLCSCNALCLLLLASSCSSTPRAGEPAPWSGLEAGALSVSAKAGVFTLYDIRGDFQASPPAGDQQAADDGQILGRYGAALRVDLALSPTLLVGLGIDQRKYEVKNLNPIKELPVRVDALDSTQIYSAVTWLLEPLSAAPRWRPYLQSTLAYLPSVDVGFEVDLSDFGSSNLRIESKGQGYWSLGLGGGLLYQWTPHFSLELGLLYEQALTPLEVDLSFELVGTKIPFDAQLEPEGLIGFLGLNWRP